MADNEDVTVEMLEVDVTPNAASPTATGPSLGAQVRISEVPNLRWSAILGGAVAALGVSALLYALGLALGLSAIDPKDPGSVRPSSIFTGIWAVAVSLIALFVGGYVAARGAGALTRMSGALHGIIMWGLTVVAGMWLLGSVASTAMFSAAVVGREGAPMVRDRVPMGDRDDGRGEGRKRARQEETRRDALQAAENTGKAFWGIFGGLVLGMFGSIAGALVGSTQRSRPRHAKPARATPPTHRREAYP